MPEAYLVAKAIRHALAPTSAPAPIALVELYAILADAAAMNGGPGQSSVWSELAHMAPPSVSEEGAQESQALSLDVVSGHVASLNAAWDEVVLLPAAAADKNTESTRTLRHWPTGDALLHLVSTWHGFSVFLPRRLLLLLQAQAAATSSAALATQLAQSLRGASLVSGPAAVVRSLCRVLASSVAHYVALSTGGDCKGVVVSATWLAPFSVLPRRWDASEASLPAAAMAFPAAAQSEPEVISNSAPTRSERATPERREVKQDAGAVQPKRVRKTSLLSRVRSLSKPSAGTNTTTNTNRDENEDENEDRNTDSNVDVNVDANGASSGDTTGTGTGSSDSSTQVTSTSTSNAGTGTAVAIGPRSAAAATASHGPTFSFIEPTAPSCSSSSSSGTAGTAGTAATAGTSSKAASTPSTGASTGSGNGVNIKACLSLFKVSLTGRPNNSSCGSAAMDAYEREKVAQREERLALMVAQSRGQNAVSTTGVAVAVPGAAASASTSAASGRNATVGNDAHAKVVADAESRGQPVTSSTAGQGAQTALQTRQANSDRGAVPLHTGKGQTQHMFTHHEEEAAADDKEEEADKENAGTTTRTTVTTVTTTDVERFPRAKTPAVVAQA